MEGITENDGGKRGSYLRIAAWAAVPLILLVPLIAMQFSDEVNWSVFDFIVFGAMLMAVGIAFELALRVTTNTIYRVAAGLAIIGAFLLVWANLAVGIIGSENNDANLMYFGVLAVGVFGGIIARFKPFGMALVMAIMTALLVLIAIVSSIMGLGSSSSNWPGGIILATGFFGVLWAGSAWLFWRAVSEPTPAGAGSAD